MNTHFEILIYRLFIQEGIVESQTEKDEPFGLIMRT